MAVTINKTDGTVLSTIQDGAIDTTSTNLSLIGRLYRNYGELVNENFVKLLENFANSSSPTIPIVGQIWYNTANGTLNVYRSTGFISLANITISTAQPALPRAGDLWFDTIDAQLKFYNGNVWTVVSPPYTQNQSKTGIFVETIADQANGNHICIVHYQQNSITAIECRDAAWIPRNSISGFTTIRPGYNLASTNSQKFYVTAFDADNLGGLAANTYVRNDQDGIIDGGLTLEYIAKDEGDLEFRSGDTPVFVLKDTIQTAFAPGDLDAPSITNIDDETTGIYFPDAGELSIVCDGTSIIDITNSGATISGDLGVNIIQVNDKITTSDDSEVYIVNGVYVEGDSTFEGNTTFIGNLRLNTVNISETGGAISISTTRGAGYSQSGDLNLGRTNGLRSYNSPKAWVAFNGTVSGLAIYDSFNVDYVLRLSARNYSFVLEFPFTNNAVALIGNNDATLTAYPNTGSTTFSVSTSGESAYMSLALFYR